MPEVKTYRRRPIDVEAIQYDGTERSHLQICSWAGQKFDRYSHFLRIATLEGEMTANPGDWIVRGTQGEFWPLKPAAFAATYEVQA